MKNKILSHLTMPIFGLVALIMISASIPGLAEENDSSYVMWEEQFEDYTGGKLKDENIVKFSGSKVPKPEDSGESRAFMTTSDSEHNIVYEFDEDITSGALWISYDVSGGDETKDGIVYSGYDALEFKSDNKYRTVYSKYSVNGNVEHIATANISSTSHGGGSNVSGDNWGETRRVRVDWILDITNQTTKVYIDGVLLRANDNVVLENGASGVPAVRGIHFHTIGMVILDNLRIEYAPECEFDFKVEEVEISEDDIKLDFTQAIAGNVDINEIAFKNLYTGEIIEPDTAVFKTRNELVFDVSGLSYTDEYQIVLPENFKNSYGETLTPAKPIFSIEDPNESFAVIGVEFEDYEENIYSLAEELNPVVKNIVLSFTDDVDVESLAEGISLISKETDEEAEISFTFETEENKVIIKLDGVFYEKEEYELKIDGVLSSNGEALSKTYAIPFAPGEGETKIIEYGFYKDGVEVSEEDINAGDEISIKFSAVKPTREATAVYLSYGVYEDEFMTDFGIEKIAFEKNITSASGELNLIIPESESFMLKGFLWQKAGRQPLTTQIELVK